jgi:hypothetical protein
MKKLDIAALKRASHGALGCANLAVNARNAGAKFTENPYGRTC